MRRISVINQKGGVGKTTSTVNLGAALAQMGKRVLLIDLDPQAHLTLHLGVDVADDQPTAYDVLTQSMPIRDVVVETRENLRILPADIDLAAAEAELISVMGREVVLREALAPVEDEYDIMLIDCPPSLGVLTINALAASTEVLIPLQAQFFALQGLSKLLDTVTLVRQRINTNLVVSGVVLCIHEAATRLGGEVVADLTQFLSAARGSNVPWADARLFGTYIRRNIKLAEASSFGQTVIEYAPKSHGACDYTNLAREMLGELPAVQRDDTVGDEAKSTGEGASIVGSRDLSHRSSTDSSESEADVSPPSAGAVETRIPPDTHALPGAPRGDVVQADTTMAPRRAEPVPFELRELRDASDATPPTVPAEEAEEIPVSLHRSTPAEARPPWWNSQVSHAPSIGSPFQDESEA